MEEIKIVNENDQVIGYKKRGTLDQKDIYRTAALWIENSKGEILLVKRALTKKRSPGLWGPAVAGTIEKDESYESNIIKEMQEELGLSNIFPKKFAKTRVIYPHNHFTQWFLLKIDKEVKDFKINKDEVEEIEWFSREELFNSVKEDSKELIKSLKIFIRKFIMKDE